MNKYYLSRGLFWVCGLAFAFFFIYQSLYSPLLNDTVEKKEVLHSFRPKNQRLPSASPLDSPIEDKPVVLSSFQRDSLAKMQARRAFSKFLQDHPYNQRDIDSYQAWKNIPKKDRPDLAWEQDYLRTLDPQLGYVPYQRKLKALEKVSKQIKDKNAIANIRWQERGPNNVAGRVRAILFDPTDPEHKKVWAGGIQGGLWYTDDITLDKPWTHVDAVWDNISITAIAADPNDDNTWYVGTGESFTAGGPSATRGAGLWKTTNAGNTWTHLTAANGFFDTDEEFHYVNDILVRNEGGGQSSLLVAVGRRFNQGRFTQGVGLYRSMDGGINFSQVLPTLPPSMGGNPYEPTDIELDANNRIWIGTQKNSNRQGGGRIFYSETGLSGSWVQFDFSNLNGTDADRVELACAPSDPDVVYAVAQNDSPTVFDQDVAWLRRTLNATDANPVWEDLAIPLYQDQGCFTSSSHFTRGQAFYNLILAVHPNDASVAILGGISLHKTTNGDTTDVAQVTWSPISYWTGDCFTYVHADAHQVLFRPDHPDEGIIGSDGGISYADDLGSADLPLFEDRINHLNITQFYAVDAANIETGGVFIAGAQDNGSQQFENGLVTSTLEVTGGDGAFCHIDQDNPDIRITSFIRNVYNVSNDGGETFTRPLNNQSQGLFINPSEYDDQANILYANLGSTNSITRISDIGGSNTDGVVNINPDSIFTSNITALKASPHTNHRIFLGTGNGRVLRVDDANTASPVTTELNTTPIPVGSISSIDVGASDDELLLTFFNYGVNSVWETSDGGSTWNNKEGDLPDIPIRWGLYNPDNRDEVLLATELGVYSSNNFGHTTNAIPNWAPSNAGLASVRCDMLQYRAADKVVTVATHGRGIFTTDVFATPTAQFEARTVGFVNRPVEFTDLSLQANAWEWDFDQNINPGVDATDQNPSFIYTTPGDYTVQLSINSGMDVETKTAYITILEEPTIPYDQDFNSNDGGFFPYRVELAGIPSLSVPPQDWEWGASNTLTYNPGNGTATVEGSANWITGLNENHGFNTRYALESPPFSLTSLTGISLEFSYRAQCGTDAGFHLEYSIDQGDTWQLLGHTQASGENPAGTNDWYNEASILGLRNQPGFSGASNTVVQPRYNISEFAGQADVRFRFVFGSRGFALDGVQIDNFRIEEDVSLPIRLISFRAKREEERMVRLDWQTASELNNQGFEIQKSSDGITFEAIAFVDGAGTTNQLQTYHYLDRNAPEAAYYRLKQIDHNGSFTYSHLDYVEAGGVTPFSFYPNPFTDVLYLETTSQLNKGESLFLEIWNPQGKLEQQTHGNAEEIKAFLESRLQNLSSGLYFIRLQTQKQTYQYKIIKK